MVKSINKDKNKERVDGDKIEKRVAFYFLIIFLNYILDFMMQLEYS